MKSKKIVNIALISVLLSSMAIGAEQSACTGSVCFATLPTVKPSKTIETKQSACDGDKCFATLSNIKPSKVVKEEKELEEIVFLEDNLDTNIDELQSIVVESEEIIEPLSDTSYVMNEEKVMDSLWIANPIEVIANKFLEKTDLPSSDYFCDNDKQPVYLNDDVYECV